MSLLDTLLEFDAALEWSDDDLDDPLLDRPWSGVGPVGPWVPGDPGFDTSA